MSYFDYTNDKKIYEGFIATNGDSTTKRPCVLVVHAWSGLTEHFCEIAKDLSNKGYIGFAIDIYGKGIRGKVEGDNSHLMNPLLNDRAMLRDRLLTAFNTAKNHPLVLSDKIAVLGYCFGGLCALDLARSNPKGLKGAISVHGGFDDSDLDDNPAKIDSSILALHGWEDPTVKRESVISFTEEMTIKKADWQIHLYGHAMHAFTFEGANIPDLGIKYDEKAHTRALQTIDSFLKEVFK